MMEAQGEKIREVARRLLEQDRVDVVIGFEKGSLPLRASPVFVRTVAETHRLIWDCFCENNLARYLTRIDDHRVAIVAKGCDSRAIVALMAERQIPRERLTIIGVPCQRMVDRRKAAAAVHGEILAARCQDSNLDVEGRDFRRSLPRDAFLYLSCRLCTHRNPVIHDVLIGDPVEESTLNEPPSLRLECCSDHQRWAVFSQTVSSCVRCFACRQACPMCYCQECFVDASTPSWIGRGTDPSDIQMWHIVRAFHMAGRCVACGACERACPMEIDLFTMLEKLNRDVKELFAFEAGISADTTPPLGTHDPDDPGDFIL